MIAWGRLPRTARIAGIGLFGVVLMCGAAPLWLAGLGVDPYAVDPNAVYLGPSRAHWLGTDALGRDVFARLLVGGRSSLSVAALAAVFATAFGATWGMWAGYRGGWLDIVLMRVTEAFIALPKLPLLILLTVTPLPIESPVLRLSGLIAAMGWMTSARLGRAMALHVRSQDFVAAARGFGASTPWVIRVHVLPHAAGPLIVAMTIDLGELLIYESVLSFLGLGLVPPEPSWGTLLKDAFHALRVAPHLAWGPGAITMGTVAAVNLLGDGLRDIVDPRTISSRGRAPISGKG